MTLVVKNMSFKQGQEMKLSVLPKSGNSGFAINIGHDTDNYALHLNPRFDSGSVVCNSQSGGSWGDECHESGCPFSEGSDNKVSISFNMDAFQIRLPDGHNITFPNRLGDVKYGHIELTGDAKLVSLKIK
ncbi:lectin, galactoside-binding, soluble, 2b [Osmerus eperlanus]|uniref:lectin, galactoside-binding, soluble, 2b n=1 Tax=Osmerus eperlanus TaxID=29151 RepID=UPI002E13118E